MRKKLHSIIITNDHNGCRPCHQKTRKSKSHYQFGAPFIILLIYSTHYTHMCNTRNNKRSNKTHAIQCDHISCVWFATVNSFSRCEFVMELATQRKLTD